MKRWYWSLVVLAGGCGVARAADSTEEGTVVNYSMARRSVGVPHVQLRRSNGTVVNVYFWTEHVAARDLQQPRPNFIPPIPDSRYRMMMSVVASRRFTCRFSSMRLLPDGSGNFNNAYVWRDSDLLAHGAPGSGGSGNGSTSQSGVVASINIWGDANWSTEYLVLRRADGTFASVWLNSNGAYTVAPDLPVMTRAQAEEIIAVAVHAGVLEFQDVPARQGWWVAYTNTQVVGR